MREKKVVVIGGGPATEAMLSKLKRYPLDLTVLISTFDASSRGPWADGTNGTYLVDEVRSSLLALIADSPATQITERLFAHKLAHSSDLENHTFGNLFLSVLTEITGTADQALKAAARVLNVQGQVLPLTLDAPSILAKMEDGTEVEVSCPAELIAAAAGTGLQQLSLSVPAKPLEAAVQAVHDADIVVLGPADFFFNVMAPLQLEGFAEALAASAALKVFVCNILTQPNTTHGWAASRFIRTVLEGMGGFGSLDYVIVDSSPLSGDALAAKAASGYYPVKPDLEECLSLKLDVIVRPVAFPDALTHDPEKLVRTILFLGGRRMARKSTRSNLLAGDIAGDLTPLEGFAREAAGA